MMFFGGLSGRCLQCGRVTSVMVLSQAPDNDMDSLLFDHMVALLACPWCDTLDS